MAIYIIDGYPGSGKTAYAVYVMKKLLERGERVFSNIKLNPKAMGLDCGEGDIKDPYDRGVKRILYWNDFEDWKLMENGTIFCDEGIAYFNSRNWEALPKDVQVKLIQHRHQKLDLYVTVTHFSRIDVVLRSLTERFLRIKLVLGSNKLKKSLIPRIARIHEYYLEQIQRLDTVLPGEQTNEALKPLWSEWFWINTRRMGWYDTSEMVGSVRIRHDLICKICGKIHTNHDFE